MNPGHSIRQGFILFKSFADLNSDEVKDACSYESHTGSCTGSQAGSQAGSQVPSEGSSSDGSECSHSTSPDVTLVQDDEEDTAAGGEEADHSKDEEAQSQGMVSLLNISTSDNEETRKAIAHKSACKSNTAYGDW